MDYLLSLKLCARKQAGVVCVGGWVGGRGVVGGGDWGGWREEEEEEDVR